ncbi:ecto-ADP-ribosyltransferase 5 [Rhinichthys klamathensis goyatoka]|uniref:ecto-ADP-ribosyltransferase 5 n=1 Tax=Rhinichthys klamathensis goyatoka TaxID=3034132 RepID=UPI0024B53C0B|nr:ecto-ADP-ribosyltransferase 5 [Rhinichthys klamathensis goyatoka]
MGRLRFPAFLLVILYTTVVQITEELIHVSMFPEAADYSFYSCRKEMLQMVTKAGGLLETELKNNIDFMDMWKGSTTCEAIPDGTPEHMTALQSYVEAGSEFHETFNKLVHTKSRGNSTYQDMFPFKSLFFLLTDAMQLLKSNCNTVYSATEEKYSFNIGDKVRFESFFPAELVYSAATEDAATFETTGTVFNINSCSVINLDKVCISEDIDLLISPTEVFTVKDIKTVSNSNDHYIEINLMHSHMYSSSNCSSLVR